MNNKKEKLLGVPTFLLSEHLWKFDDGRQRVTLKQLQELALQDRMTVTYKGTVRELTYKKIVPGVYEIFKKPLKSDDQTHDTWAYC